MTNKIKNAFDGIHAEDSLKEKTLHGLREKMQAQEKPRRYINVRRLTTIAACLVFVLFSGVFSYNLYFTEAAYIGVDINPSLELTINRFDRVISVTAYNADAEELIANINLKYKNVDAAIDEIVSATAKSGTLQREGLVSVTVQSLSGDEAQLLDFVQANVTDSVRHHGGAVVDVFSVDSDTRTAAHDLHISPAKYLAILALQAVDPTVTVEECQDHTIGEINQRTEAHSENEHHSENGNFNELEDRSVEELNGNMKSEHDNDMSNKDSHNGHNSSDEDE